MNICPVGVVLFHVDGETDKQADRWTDGQADRYDKANSHFLQFCKHM